MAETHQYDEFAKAISDMATLGLYYLLCPGEYSYAKDNDHPFHLEDVSFQLPSAAINVAAITQQQLQLATKEHVKFTDQKNGKKGEALTHGNNDESLISPLKVLQ
jgi:hypothetical protein